MRARPATSLAAVAALVAAAGAVAVALLFGAETPHADACAIVPPDLEMRVAMEREEAVIVWDEAAQVQHFIRRAAFSTEAKDFGFLVPTPTRPTIHEADTAIFDALVTATARVPRTRLRMAPENALIAFRVLHSLIEVRSGAPASAAVRVLETARVAGMEAAILEADRADALADWLKANGYPSRHTLEVWLKPYVDAKYVITAFRLAAPDVASGTAGSSDATGTGRAGLHARSVRMSFSTDEPFFPYREPHDAAQTGPRLLRVYYVGAGPARARLAPHAPGRRASFSRDPWPGRIRYSRPFDAALVCPQIAALITTTSTAEPSWLTEFVDSTFYRPSADLYFDRDERAGEVVPTDDTVIDVPPFLVPTELIVVVALVLWRKRRRARATRSL